MKIVSLCISLLLLISCAHISQGSNYENRYEQINYENRKELFDAQLSGANDKFLNNEFTFNENSIDFSSKFTGKDEVVLALKSKESWKCDEIMIMEETIKDGYRTYPYILGISPISKGLSVFLTSDDNITLNLNYGFFKELINNNRLLVNEESFSYEGWDFIYKRNYDEFVKREIIRLKPTYRSVLRSPDEDKINHLWGTPIIIKEVNKIPTYLFMIRYEASDWIFIQENNSFFVIADTLNYNFDSVKIERDTFNGILGARIVEEVYFQFTKEQMENIFFADNLKFKVNSKKGFIKTVVPNSTKLYWRKFFIQDIK